MITVDKRKVTWTQAENMIKKTGRFIGYIRYRNLIQAFDTNNYPFASGISDKISLLANELRRRGDYRGKGSTLWIDDINSVTKEAITKKEFTICKRLNALPDDGVVLCIDPMTISISEPEFPNPLDLTKHDVWGIINLNTMKQVSTGMVVTSGGENCPYFGDTVPFKAVTVVCRINDVDDVKNWLNQVQGAGCIQKQLQVNDQLVAIRAHYKCE
ncbi:hypothetical protein [Paenibacillus periandrae]|uniref:hypothetical protein n=1 Tax=Paenibacillus periandrae TaxID=1761741 RepID=UPI001F09242A|nr:hypothetical protein [Paenibacillus periandrae]